MKTKITLITALGSAVFAWSVLAQEPTATPAPPVPAATVAPIATPAAKGDLEAQIERDVNGHGMHIHVGRDRSEHVHHDDDSEWLAVPIVGIIFGTICFAPVAIVGVILLFNFMRQRSLHRTVRMMVEKGQPIPPGLFSSPQIVRARSDMRRGVVLIMVGIGVMIFFGAVNDWEGGSWSLGMIPFLIGAGYLTVWKLEGNKPSLTTGAMTTPTHTSTDNPPPVP